MVEGVLPMPRVCVGKGGEGGGCENLVVYFFV